MFRIRIIVALAIFCVSDGALRAAWAQQFFQGSTTAELQFSGNSGIDLNGRSVNVDGRPFDRYGQSVDDYGWPARNYRYQKNSASGFYSPGGYAGATYPSGSNISPNGNVSSARPYGISPPRTVMVGGVYPSRTVLNNATRGTVIEYTHNGNGYISTPGSTYQTVISNGPSIYPYVSVVPPSQPPVIIDSRPTQVVSKTFPGKSSSQPPTLQQSEKGQIQLICPKESLAPLTYLLNGTIYTIKPGYTQTFPEDRAWTIEFLRNGNANPRVIYNLRAGTYRFEADANGWDLKLYPPVAQPDIPPAPAPPNLNEKVPNLLPAPSPSSDL